VKNFNSFFEFLLVDIGFLYVAGKKIFQGPSDEHVGDFPLGQCRSRITVNVVVPGMTLIQIYTIHHSTCVDSQYLFLAHCFTVIDDDDNVGVDAIVLWEDGVSLAET
jgi:hypothetical protein